MASPEGTDPLPEAVRGRQNISVVELPFDPPRAPMSDVRLFRALTDLVRFYRPELDEADWPRRRTAQRVLDFAGHPNGREAAGRLAAVRVPPDVHANAEEMLTAIEQHVPAEPRLLDAVEALGVDAALLISRCSLGGGERDLLKVTRALGLPSVMLVWSWDNLSSKAVLHEHPDHLLVWNELQVDEAERLQGIPRDRVDALGAPSFDEFFSALETVERPRPRRQDHPLPRVVDEHLARGARSGVPRVAGGSPRGSRPGGAGGEGGRPTVPRRRQPGVAGGRSRRTSRSSAGRSSRPPASPERWRASTR